MDTISDDIDNCPNTANLGQDDLDGDQLGDLCDDDIDGDSILNEADNCPRFSNIGQWDKDKDGIGNECDDDIDGDLCLNVDEPNSMWYGKINACQPQGDDCDNDGVSDHIDNCPDIANRGQWDKDEDGIGNECDEDIDGDGFSNQVELAAGSKPWDSASVPESLFN